MVRMTRMIKSGLITLWNQKDGVQGDDCLYPLAFRADVKKIGLSHMIDCFFMLGFGLAIGVILLIIEIIKKRQQPSQQQFQLKATEQKIWYDKLIAFYYKVSNGQLYDS